ncbi:T9SS type A sorting domain-containing protein [Rasiella sp. SM2506]|uniref:T9SS type A sorting domain-containing protein n=1 Tax=Rasiella sp. SM2506 TaxID=3423914 RepID=UPI003D7C0EF7
MKTQKLLMKRASALVLFFFLSTQLCSSQTWEELPELTVGAEVVTDVVTIESFDNTVYFCTDKGLFASSDNGSTTTNLTYTAAVTLGKPIRCVFEDLDTGDLYCGSDTDIYKSTDGGTTWSLTSIPTALQITDITKTGNNIVVAYDNGTMGGVYYSADGLATSQLATGLPDMAMFDFQPYDGTLFLAGKLAVYKSTDNGITWSVSGTGHPATATYFKMINEGTSLFAGDVFGGGLYKSTDSGASWANDSGDYEGFCQVFDLTSSNGTIVTVVDGGVDCNGGEPIKVSTDDGLTWTSGLFNLDDAFYSELGRNGEGSCLFVYSPSLDSLYRICDLVTLGSLENKQDTISIYPNPTEGLLHIKSATMGTIHLLNAQGQLLRSYNTTTVETILDISQFTSGIYFLRVETSVGVLTCKVLKE